MKKIGNSLYVTIPRRVARLLNIRAGDRLVMVVEGSVIRMTRANFREIIGAMLARTPGLGA